jgi:tRNA(adenine34) deaminase
MSGARTFAACVRITDMQTRCEAWEALGPVWRAAFEQAWIAFRAGSPPVGAVVVDGDGAIASRGRSRRAERTAPVGVLAGSRLAHAELNALAGLSVSIPATYALYTTLEPCLLCASAAVISRVESLYFAGPDPVWTSLTQLPGIDLELEKRWYARYGPLTGPMGVWASLLPLAERLNRNPHGARVAAYKRLYPALVQKALHLLRDDSLRDLAALSIGEALDRLWPDLLALEFEQRSASS